MILIENTQVGTAPADVKEESAFWKQVFRTIFDHYSPGQKAAVVRSWEKGEYAVFLMEEDGLKPVENHIYFKDKSLYEVKKFRKISPETGQHLFYDIVPNNMGDITVDIGGRYGQTGGTNAGADLIEGAYVAKPYPSYLYWAKAETLLRKGYMDFTEEVYDAEEEIAEVEKLFAPEDAPEGDENETVLRIAEFLGNCARQVLAETIDVDWMSSKPPFNRRQVTSARKTWNTFKNVKSVDDANNIIVKLLAITDVSFKEGKHKKRVSDFLVLETGDRKRDFDAIAQRIDQWDTIIMAMEAVLPPPEAKKGEKKKEKASPFGDITMKMAPEEENARIRKLFKIASQWKTKYVEVNCPAFEERFKKHVERRGIEVIKELIHGSRTSNWMSIIMTGLLLNPDAPITGKALGNGIYTALEFEKSRGYTDYYGSKWAGGQKAVGVIGVYKTGYGDPMYAIPGKWGSYYDKEFPKSGKDCLHAKKGDTGWRMDEIVFFHEEALVLEGLIFYSEEESALNWLY